MHAVTLNSADKTAALAQAIAPHLRNGDTLLLSGEIGAGKTHFARALILAILEPLGLAEDIPSPTFTLIQTYEAGMHAIWHADLYRLCAADEVVELGLLDAFHEAICLVEWPDALGKLSPTRRLELGFTTDIHDENLRHLQIRPVGDWPWLEQIAELRDV